MLHIAGHKIIQYTPDDNPISNKHPNICRKKSIQTNDQEALQIIDRYLDTFHGYHQGGTESSTQRERALIQILY